MGGLLIPKAELRSQSLSAVLIHWFCCPQYCLAGSLGASGKYPSLLAWREPGTRARWGEHGRHIILIVGEYGGVPQAARSELNGCCVGLPYHGHP